MSISSRTGSHPNRRILVDALSVAGGGGRTYLVNVLRELSRDDRGFEFTVLVEPGSLDQKASSGVSVREVRLPGNPRAARVAARVLYEQTALPLRARSYALLYCLADLSPAVTATPTVVALRNLNVYDPSFYDTPRLRALRGLAHLGIRRARRIIVPTRAAGDLITERFPIPAERLAVVPHGVSAGFLDERRTEPDGMPYLFLPAALERHKNIETLIRALPLLDPPLRLRIAGAADTDPEYAAFLRQLVADMHLEAQVEFLGGVPYERIGALYRGAYALVFPSRLETFGHPLLEAMLLGTPVVAADIPAFREVAGNAALFFPPTDEHALARAVKRIGLDTAGSDARRAQGRERAAGFSWRRSVDDLCRVFEEVLGKNSEPSSPSGAAAPG